LDIPAEPRRGYPARQYYMSEQSSTEKKHRCWIVKWNWIGDHRRPDPLCHLLPYRWGNPQVRDYVKALYANSEHVDSLSALALLRDRKFWNSRLKDDGCLITTSTNPALEAHRVTDLTVEYNGKERKEILRWTRPMYSVFVKYSTGSRLEPIGMAMQESYERICSFLPFPFGYSISVQRN
jgi:hypothetical protein